MSRKSEPSEVSSDQTFPGYDAATDDVSVLALLLTTIQRQLSPDESRELFHLAVEDTRLFAAGVLSAYADRRLDLEPRCRRAAILLLRDM